MAFTPDEPEVSGFIPDIEELPVADSTRTVESTYSGQREPYIEEKLFPSTLQTWKSAEAPMAKVAAGAAMPMTLLGDILGIPQRFVSQARGQKMEDPSAAFWRPEMEKVKGALKEPERKPVLTGETRNIGGKEYKMATGMLPTLKDVPGEIGRMVGTAGTELAGQMASDPLTALMMLSKIFKPVIGLAPKGSAKILGLTSGLEPEVIEQAAKTPKRMLVGTAGREKEIAQRALEAAEALNPEVGRKSLLKQMGGSPQSQAAWIKNAGIPWSKEREILGAWEAARQQTATKPGVPWFTGTVLKKGEVGPEWLRPDVPLSVQEAPLLEQARAAAIARQLGMKTGSEGVPLWSTQAQSGRALIPTALALMGAPATHGLSLPGVLASSPKVAVNTQELIEALTKMAQATSDVTGRGIPYGIAGAAARTGTEFGTEDVNE